MFQLATCELWKNGSNTNLSLFLSSSRKHSLQRTSAAATAAVVAAATVVVEDAGHVCIFFFGLCPIYAHGRISLSLLESGAKVSRVTNK